MINAIYHNLSEMSTTNIIEIEIYVCDYKPNKQQWDVNYFDGEDYQDTTIALDDLLQHVQSYGLNELQDFPSHGDVTTVDAQAWLSDNTDTAIKHYLANK